LNTFIPILCANVVLYFCWVGVNNVTGLYSWTVVYGLCAAGFQSLFPTAVTSLDDDLSRAGTRLGMAFSTIGFAALVGGPIGGAILSSAGDNYVPAILWGATTTACGTVLVIAARVCKKGWTLKVKC
jgi:MFS family permease